MRVVDRVLFWVSILAGAVSGIGSAVLVAVAADRQDAYLLTASLFLFVIMFVFLYYSSLLKKGESK